ncbi:MAG: nitroreductase family protein [Desulfobacterales bacterium]|nr:nitroreductase family protein [Desulfobacterales bacterium]
MGGPPGEARPEHACSRDSRSFFFRERRPHERQAAEPPHPRLGHRQHVHRPLVAQGVFREIQTLFEAARWAPSCFNEQPWRFVYATEPEKRAKLVSCLVAKNQLWASQAPLLMFVLARRNFQKTDKENRHAPYDAGAAWMALALQARKLGLYAHAMAGFNLEKAYEVLGASREEYLVMAAIAVGRKTEDSGLPDDLRAMESPNSRKPHAEVATNVFPLSHPA